MQALTIEEELFCTRYELEILSGIVNLNMLERWVPGFCRANTHKEHVCRYNWVKDFVKNKTVLDIACGTGFGSRIMATEGGAASVLACDIDERSVKYASLKNRNENLNFRVQNAENFETENKFNVAVSFETIEHLHNPQSFLQCISKALNDDGMFFVSTPISNVPQNDKPDNIYHVTEWGFKRFHSILEDYFTIEDVYLQLYSVPPKIDNRKISKALRKAGITKANTHAPVERVEPFKWQPNEMAAESIGTKWAGYQIVQCKKK